uniref:(northern house mosquito) hypothetical protein n=1 Tax=Culex pipiens TaxID=7175 RepID=A0A8D8IAM4_CULPI
MFEELPTPRQLPDHAARPQTTDPETGAGGRVPLRRNPKSHHTRILAAAARPVFCPAPICEAIYKRKTNRTRIFARKRAQYFIFFCWDIFNKYKYRARESSLRGHSCVRL